MKRGDLVQVIGTDQIRKVERIAEQGVLSDYAALDLPVKGWKVWPICDLRVVKGKRCKKP